MSRCQGCARRWSGMTECHCSECHRQFSSVGAFDKHRTDFQCVDPAALQRQDGNPVLEVTDRRDGPVWHVWHAVPRSFWAGILVAVLLLTGCVSGVPTDSSSQPDGTVTTSSASHKATPTHKRTAQRRPVGVLPNRSLTPGAVDPRVTQANIGSTICRVGYTRTVRPPQSYTSGLKRQQLASGYTYRGDINPRHYELDHLIPLELGGSPAAVANLWPEPYLPGTAAVDGARDKDKVENALHRLVCSGAVSLRVAQRAIARNWITAYQRYT